MTKHTFVPTGEFNAKDLIPEWWKLRGIDSIQDLIFLGSVSVREMIRHWRGAATSNVERVRRLEERIALVKDGEGLKSLSERNENPTFNRSEMTVPKDSWDGSPEPTDAASINRKGGATTLNRCGWCKFSGGGTCRYSYNITTNCGLLSDAGLPDRANFTITEEALEKYRNETFAGREQLEAAYPGIREVALGIVQNHETVRRFSTACTIKFMDEAGLATLASGLEQSRDRLVAEKRVIDRKIRYLLQLEKATEKKPALAGHRAHDWFNVDDTVVCYIGGWEGRTIQEDWATASVIYGYRHHDGCVSVRYEKKVHDGEYLEGHGGGYGMSRPEVLHKWEFEYLVANPDFAKVWVQNAPDHLEGFVSEELLRAFTSTGNIN